VVDDDEAILGMVAEALRDEEFLVDEASNGAEALGYLHSTHPDVILLDLMMPVMDGWTFVDRCRLEPGCEAIPIVVMSATTRLAETAEDLQHKGVRACLVKPFDLDVLIGILERVTRPIANA
jgi:CheY-like chemotaxis protein